MESLAAALGIGMATLGTGLGMGFMVGKTMDAMARQPELSGELRTTMLIAIAFMEALALYALVISFLLVFK